MIKTHPVWSVLSLSVFCSVRCRLSKGFTGSASPSRLHTHHCLAIMSFFKKNFFMLLLHLNNVLHAHVLWTHGWKCFHCQLTAINKTRDAGWMLRRSLWGVWSWLTETACISKNSFVGTLVSQGTTVYTDRINSALTDSNHLMTDSELLGKGEGLEEVLVSVNSRDLSIILELHVDWPE